MSKAINYKTISRCRLCSGEKLIELFSLGSQFVSDFPEPGLECSGPQCPITLVLCPNCTLVQQLHTAPQDFMYSRVYWYRSGVTQTMRDALKDVVQAAEKLVDLKSTDVVLDIGANDGTGLRSYSKPCIKVGVEPADNLQEEGKQGIDLLIHDFWGYSSFQKSTVMKFGLPNKWPKVVTALGMMYDAEDPNPFVGDIARVLHPQGVFIAQLMCLKQTLQKGDVGNLAHEHLLFFSLKSLLQLYNSHNLRIFRVEENEVNGGSYRIYADLGYRPVESSVAKALDSEAGYGEPSLYTAWYNTIQRNRDATYEYLHHAVNHEGKKLHVLGASTKGNVIMQWLGIDHRMVQCASDRSPWKHGKVMVGSGIPIVSEEESRAMSPDLYLVLPYAFKAEIIARERNLLLNGGRLAFVLPEFHTVGAEVLS